SSSRKHSLAAQLSRNPAIPSVSCAAPLSSGAIGSTPLSTSKSIAPSGPIGAVIRPAPLTTSFLSAIPCAGSRRLKNRPVPRQANPNPLPPHESHCPGALLPPIIHLLARK